MAEYYFLTIVYNLNFFSGLWPIRSNDRPLFLSLEGAYFPFLCVTNDVANIAGTRGDGAEEGSSAVLLCKCQTTCVCRVRTSQGAPVVSAAAEPAVVTMAEAGRAGDGGPISPAFQSWLDVNGVRASGIAAAFVEEAGRGIVATEDLLPGTLNRSSRPRGWVGPRLCPATVHQAS